jgi:hypothetical protein
MLVLLTSLTVHESLLEYRQKQLRVNTAIYIHNRLVNPKTGKTPIIT